jgi:hypothetical protein
MKKIITAATMAAILAAAPAVAQNAAPAPAAETQLGSQGESAQFPAGAGAYVIGAILAGLLIWGFIELVDDNNNDEEISPG